MLKYPEWLPIKAWSTNMYALHFWPTASANFINFRGRGKYSAHSPKEILFSLTALHDQLSFIHRSHVSYVSFFTSGFLGVLKTLKASCYETAKQNSSSLFSISRESLLATNRCMPAKEPEDSGLRLFKGKLAVCVNEKCINLTKLTDVISLTRLYTTEEVRYNY